MNDKLNILVIPSFYPMEDKPNNGIFIEEQTKMLCRFGVQTSLIFRENRSLKDVFRTNIAKYHNQVCSYDEDGIRTIRKHTFNIIPTRYKIGSQIWIDSTIKLCEQYIARYGRPDIIHAHCALYGGHVANILYKKYNIPYVLTEHLSLFGKGLANNYQNSITKEAFTNAYKVIAVSSQFRKYLIKYFNYKKDNIVVINNFIDCNFFEPTNRDKYKNNGNFCFFSVANLNQLKRMDRLIKAFCIAFKGDTNIKLQIGGDGPERKRLEYLSKELECNNQISFLGELSRKQVKFYMQQSHAFILLSDIETFGVVFIEALACGLPVIGTACGGPQDIIIPGVGFLVEKDIHESVNSMKNMIEIYSEFDPKFIRNYALENFSSESQGKKIMDVYSQVKKIHSV